MLIRKLSESSDLEIVEKSSEIFDPQTAADRSAEIFLFSCINNFFPNLSIIGEEGCGRSDCPDWNDEVKQRVSVRAEQLTIISDDRHYDMSALTLWIDPIDGTRDFVKKNFMCVTTLIGISFNDEPIAGVIYRPFFNEGVLGSKETGVWRVTNDSIQRVVVNSTAGNIKVLTSASRSSSILDEKLAKLKKSLDTAEVIKTGGAGWKFWLMIFETSEIYFYPQGGMGFWDVCAGDSILKALGGKVTDCQGENFTYSKQGPSIIRNGVIASIGNRVEHSKICSLA